MKGGIGRCYTVYYRIPASDCHLHFDGLSVSAFRICIRFLHLSLFCVREDLHLDGGAFLLEMAQALRQLQ